MGGEAWSNAEERVLRCSLRAGNTDKEIAQLLTHNFPNSPRTVVAVRGKRCSLKLNRRQHLPAERPSAQTTVKPRFTNKEEDVIVIIKDAYPKARWWQIAAAFNICVESRRQRSGDGVKRRYHMAQGAVVRHRIRMEFKEEILRKVSPFFSTLPASTAKAQSQSPDRLAELVKQHSFVETQELAMEERPVEYSYDVTAERRSPSTSIAYPAEPQYGISYYHPPSAYYCSNTSSASSMLDSQFSEWVDCTEDIGSTGVIWPFPDNNLFACYDIQS